MAKLMWFRVALFGLVLGLPIQSAVAGLDATRGVDASNEVAADEKKEEPLTPAAAAKKVDQAVVMEMFVKSTGSNKNDTIVFLNSEANHRDEKNFTIVIQGSALDKFKAAKIVPKDYFKDRTIRITGIVTEFQGKTQIKISKPEQIEIVKK
jgi:DNA/RNA endonuclease YhcR with UshA esterase domain